MGKRLSDEEKKRNAALKKKAYRALNRDKVNARRRARDAERRANGTLPKRVLSEEQKAKARARMKKWTLENPERYKKNQERAPSHQPEACRTRTVVNKAKVRAIEAGSGGDYEAAEKLIREWRGKDSFTCEYCSRVFSIEDHTVDHIIPISRGGDHDPANMTESCRSCNSSKGANLLAEWEGPPSLRS